MVFKWSFEGGAGTGGGGIKAESPRIRGTPSEPEEEARWALFGAGKEGATSSSSSGRSTVIFVGVVWVSSSSVSVVVMGGGAGAGARDVGSHERRYADMVYVRYRKQFYEV